jgi:hypothetical protein
MIFFSMISRHNLNKIQVFLDRKGWDPRSGLKQFESLCFLQSLFYLHYGLSGGLRNEVSNVHLTARLLNIFQVRYRS